MTEKYSFCESINGPILGRWHIRKLTEAGPKYGGGIDTGTLCGRDFRGWDLQPEINEQRLTSGCKKCVELYKKALEKNKED